MTIEKEIGDREKAEERTLVDGIVSAAIELACLRHDLCYEDSPPIVVEECAEIVADVQNAIFGTDTCDPNPVPEVLKFREKLVSLEMENQRLKQDNEHLKCFIRCDPEETIEDGFGSVWSRTCPACGLATMHVNRPGEVQCDYCNGIAKEALGE